MNDAQGWRDVPGYEGLYQINAEAQVRRLYKHRQPKMMVPYERHLKHRMNQRRMYINLTKDAKKRVFAVSTLMIRMFLDGGIEGIVYMHADGDFRNNALSNLMPASRSACARISAERQWGEKKLIAKVDKSGKALKIYRNIREAGADNHYCHQSVLERLNGKIKHEFAGCDFTFRWVERKGGYEE